MFYVAAVCAATCVAWAAQPAYDTLISHRGESHDAPENTLPAFKLAVERGFGFECDIYLSADKRIFSFHDANLKRTTGKDIPCSRASWADVISKVDAGAWKGPQWKGTRPALLEEILDLARDGREIYIEVKGSSTEIVPYIKETLARQTKATPKNVLFIAFSKEVCKALKAQLPAYRTYWLTIARMDWKPDARPRPAEDVIATLKELGVDGVDQEFNPEIVTADYIAAIRQAGFSYHVWTINSLDVALQAFTRGAQTVTTDCAQRLRAEFDARQIQR